MEERVVAVAEAERWAGYLAGIARRDQQAMGDLYDEAGRLVYTTCLRILRQPADAEETAHDVWLQVWHRADRFDPARGSAAAWLTVLARSRALDQLRRRQPRSGIWFDGPETEPVASTPGPDRLALDGEDRTRTLAALASLPEPQRRLIALSFLGGQSHAAIASSQGLALGTAKTRIRAGLRRLRSLLDAEPGAPARPWTPPLLRSPR